eukprot:gnl/TRDRNA2_/TRDRNA2_179584_c0_seq1.p1 gnl/TRDRNA2_/TRDRNA2_179584_c0~~gnl/TRDRNA2_/TRDRNA2_179584_c0_seq1.p1  ORF type:complete len:479 (+),score=120.00 gnl/TRDRNA2_/TRDRNA2_179584_c0_seq1:59-1495(+)
MTVEATIKSWAASKKGGDGKRIVQAYGSVAEAQMWESTYGMAIQSAREGLEFAKTLGKEEQVSALETIVKVETHDKNFSAAVATAQEALAIAEGDKKLMAAALKMASVAQLAAGDPEAVGSAAKALKIMKEVGSDADQATYMLNLGEVQLASGEVSDALASLQDAVKLHKASSKMGGQAKALLALSEAHVKNNDMVSARTSAVDSAAVSEKEGELAVLAGALTVQAKVALRYGELAPAAKAAKKAVELYTNFDDWEGWAKACQVHIEVSSRRGDSLQAASGAGELAAYYRSAGNAEGLVRNLHEKAKALLADLQAGGPTTVTAVSQAASEAQSMYKSLGDLSGQGKAVLVKAGAQLHSKGWSTACCTAKEAQKLCKEASDKQGEAECLVLYVTAMVNRGQEMCVEGMNKTLPRARGNLDPEGGPAKVQFDQAHKAVIELKNVSSDADYKEGEIAADNLLDAIQECRAITGLPAGKIRG